MKKIVLSIIYPVWFFFGKTWVGNLMMIPITVLQIPLLIHLMVPSLMATSGEESEGIAGGVLILSLLCSPFLGGGFMAISQYLENNYVGWRYKTEMDTKMA